MNDTLTLHEEENALRLTDGTHQISIVPTDLVQMKADAIVVPVSRNMDVDSGITHVVLSAAGGKIKRYKPILPEPLGKVVVLPPGKLNAQYLFLTVFLGEKNLPKLRIAIREAIDRTLQYADFLRLESLAFPMLGSAEVSPPFKDVAQEMIQQTLNFFKRRQTDVKKIDFCILNPEAFDAFKQETKALVKK